MSSTLLFNRNEERDPINDLILEKNGRYVKFADELTQHVLKKGSSENNFTLHQTVMVIDYENTADTATIHDGVKKAVEGSIINWNFIDFRGTDRETTQPEIFRHIKPSGVVTAAGKAGIIPRSKTMRVIKLSLVILTSFFAAGLIRLFIATGPVSLSLLFEILKGGWHDWMLLSLAIAISIMEGIILAVLSGYFKTHSPRSLKMINDRLRTTNITQTINSGFIAAVKERFLKLAMPMAIMVGDPQSLDAFSKDVLINILTDEHCGTIGQILCIICEKGKRDRGHVVFPSTEKNGLPAAKIDHHYVFVGQLPKGKKPAMGRYPMAA